MQIEEESQGWSDQKEYVLWDKPPLWVKLKHKGESRDKRMEASVGNEKR